MATGAAARATDIERTQTGEGKSLRVLFQTETIKLQEVFFEAGAEAAGHAHREDQAGFIVSGRFQVTLDGTPHELSGGDAYSIPGGVVHAIRSLETGSYVLFSALSTGEQAASGNGHDHGHEHGHGRDHGAHSHG